jgi:heat shock protein HslJ
MNKLSKVLLLSMCMVTFLSFSQKPKNAVKESAIPYEVLHNYFVKNTFKKDVFSNPKINSQVEFDALFGCATTMGENGKPTNVNFKTHYIIAITIAETDRITEITPVSLIKKGKKIIFSSHITPGEKTSATFKPSLLISVDRKYKGKIETIISQTIAEPSQEVNSLPLSSQWIIESFGISNDPIKTKNSYITIQSDMLSFSGKGGCNTINGNIKVAGNSIHFSGMISTQMACDFLEQEDKFLKCLEETTNYKITGAQLFLYKNDVLLMTLESYR